MASLPARGVTSGSWPLVHLECCWEPLLSSSHSLSVQRPSSSRAVGHPGPTSLSLCGEGDIANRRFLGSQDLGSQDCSSVHYSQTSSLSEGWPAGEGTPSLHANTDLSAAPPLQAGCSAVSWGESQSVLGLAGCVWGNKDTWVIWMQGGHRPGSCRGGKGLPPTPLWACASEGDCWQKKDSLRVPPICCVSNSKISLSFSIKMSIWKMSYDLCCWGW